MTSPSANQPTADPRLAWYLEARFGLFIHWGAYSVAGVEASWPIMAPELSAAMFGTTLSITEEEYTALPGRFNPAEFDPETWVRLAQQAGMRYIIITAKHHDGFCMFDAPGTDYKITNTPFGRDICLELSQACARAGMPLGFYYSPPDMHHPGYRATNRPATRNWLGEPRRKEWGQYLDHMESHIRKLLTDYEHVSILWFDGLVNHAKYDPPRFHRLVHELSPSTLINDRLGDGYDFITPEQFIPKAGIPIRTGRPPSGNDPGSESFFRIVTALFKVPILSGLIRRQMQKYATGELELTPVPQEAHPSPQRFQPWETCMTMGQTWAHNPHEADWKPPAALLQNLVDVASRGGNYLLNVGPTATGTFPPQAVERLEAIGRWMGKHHQAIHGSTYTPLQGLPWGRATRKGNRLFLFIHNWPANGRLVIDPFPGTPGPARLFEGGALPLTLEGSHLEIRLPAAPPDTEIPVIEVEIDATEPGWRTWSPEKPLKNPPAKYLRIQALNSAWINSLLNGLIAFFSYRSGGAIPFIDASIDILITVFIITFLVGWIAIGLARQEISKGSLAHPAPLTRRLKMPQGAALRALVISLACVIVLGGVVLSGGLALVSPGGLGPWAYIIFKTLYTGAAAALASALSIWSVFHDWRTGHQA